MGLLNNAIPFSLIVWGQQHIASGVASILNAATPLFTVLLAHVLTDDERLNAGKLAGVLIGFAGVAVLLGPQALWGGGVQLGAQLLCLLGALSFALAGIFGRRFHAMGVTPLATATGQLTASSVVMLPLALWIDRPWELAVPGAPVVVAVLALAVLSTALAYVLYFRLLASAGATNLLLVTLLIPVGAVALGVALLHEPLLPQHALGMGLIGLGLLCIDGRAGRRAAWRSGR
jgi:drug/metabolite transporter (DMT)-like permease